MAFLDGTGLGTVWGRIKTWVAQYANITSSTSGGNTTNTINIGTNSVVIPNRTSELSNDAGFITGADIPEGAAASSATPLMDGTASVGTSNAFARGDHRHPSDTTKADKVTGGTAGNFVALDSNGNIVDSGKNASSVLSALKVDGVQGATINRYGVCSTAANTAAKTVNVSGGTFSLETGAQVVVKFNNVNTAENPTLNVNSTGAKGISVNIAGDVNGTCHLVYNGTTWELIGTYIDTYTRADIDLMNNHVNGIIDNSILTTGTTADGDNFNTGAVVTVPYQVGSTDYTADIKIGEGGIEMGQNGFIYISDKTSATTGSPHTMAYISGTRVNVPNADAQFSTISIVNGTSTQILMADGSIKNVGGNNGIASLDSSGKVPSSQLPSYVDDVVEVYARSGQTALSQNWLATESASGTVVSPEAGKIYVLMNNGGTGYPINSQYRWGGSSYVKLNDGGVSALSTAEIEAACPYNS